MVRNQGLEQAGEEAQEMSQGIGLAIARDNEGTPYMYLMAEGGGLSVSVFLADNDNADHAVTELIRGLKTVRADLKREASGLVLVKGVPDGLRPAQGR